MLAFHFQRDTRLTRCTGFRPGCSGDARTPAERANNWAEEPARHVTRTLASGQIMQMPPCWENFVTTQSTAVTIACRYETWGTDSDQNCPIYFHSLPRATFKSTFTSTPAIKMSLMLFICGTGCWLPGINRHQPAISISIKRARSVRFLDTRHRLTNAYVKWICTKVSWYCWSLLNRFKLQTSVFHRHVKKWG